VAITGKGREPYIRVAKGKRIPWSDVEAAQEVLKGEKH
jgi:UDP-N-acetylmuramyl tripeptide synthase